MVRGPASQASLPPSNIVSTMQAVVFDQPGDPQSVLQVRDVELGQPEHGEVLVRMLASPVNPSDLMFVRGEYTLKPELPAIPGFEGVGVVEASGGGLLGRFMVGKRVAVLNRGGGNWAERTVLPARGVIPLPSWLSVDQAATYFVNPASAVVMTRHVLAVPAGQWLLQTAAGSALGKMVVRLGRRFGFRTLCIVRRPDQVAELQQLGADAVLAFDPDRDDLLEFVVKIRDITGGQGVPFAIDPVGGATGSLVVKVLGRGARMLVFGTLSGSALTLAPRDLMSLDASISGFWLGNYMDSLKLLAKLKLVRQISGLIREGVLGSDVGQRFPLSAIEDAVVAAQQPARSGKVLLTICDR